ncbi:MAG TPA: hypothetical protein ENK13_03015 [Thermopetrobacter sp.]|nr:hypothetical protein [Thermopetrobacter sp.]
MNKVISDKEVVIGQNAQVGDPDTKEANRDFPSHLNTGITLIGKWAEIPSNARVGGNCIIYPRVTAKDWKGGSLPSGSTLKK